MLLTKSRKPKILFFCKICTIEFAIRMQITVLESACISAPHHMTKTLSRDLFVFLDDNKQFKCLFICLATKPITEMPLIELTILHSGSHQWLLPTRSHWFKNRGHVDIIKLMLQCNWLYYMFM